MSYHVSPAPFATFSSSQTQAIANKANAQAITFNTTGVAKGITLVSNTQITFPQVGNYAISFSAIGEHSGSSSPKTFNIFLRKNGSDVANSSTIVTLVKQQPLTIVATFDFTCTTAGDYCQIMMAGEETDCQITATNAQVAVPGTSPAQPASPSIIVAVWQIN